VGTTLAGWLAPKPLEERCVEPLANIRRERYGLGFAEYLDRFARGIDN
jgi:hypothetical protein